MKIAYPENVKKIAQILASAGHRAYAVGGCVRDSVMGKVPNDWDMTTSARPDEMLSVFDAAGIRTIPTGLKHGTVTVLLDGEQYECTSFRIDGEYSDSRHPDKVTFTSDVRDDLRRRDFTVNAMAGDPICDGDDGAIIDLFGGKKDIENKLIRCVGDANLRFREDALRILRAIRFATVLDFDIEESTKAAARELCHTLDNVSIERKITELRKMLLSPFADRGVDLLFDIGAQKYIHPDAKSPCVPLSSLPEDFCCRLAALFGTDGAPALGSLKLSRLEEKNIKSFCSNELYRSENTPANARYLLSVLGDCAEGAALLRGNVSLAQTIRKEREKSPCVTVADLALDGNDLILKGIPPREVGRAMQAMLDRVIQAPELNERNKLFEIISEIYKKT